MHDVLEIDAPVYGDYVLEDMLTWRQLGLKTALLTLVRIDGSSPRPLGSQIAVAEDGRAIGAITGGCAEQALVLDALAAMSRGRNHVELYGEGSRFKDLILPCGSGIRVAFDVTLSEETLINLVEARHLRQACAYIYEDGELRFERPYRPQPQLIILGRGNIVPLLAQMARLSEFEVRVFSSDHTTRDRSASFAPCHGLHAPTDWTPDTLDAASAVVSLFHDHDYEMSILDTALRSPAFYIGALGSRRAHQMRMDRLGSMGWATEALQRIHGPVGLDIGALTPPEIALSILSEIVGSYRRGATPT